MSGIAWTDPARDQLADIYVATPAPEREELVQVVLGAERELASNPMFAGESRGENVRVLLAPRLTFFYILVQGGGVQIYRVRPSRRRWKDAE